MGDLPLGAWLVVFAIAATVVVVAAIHLARNADILAEETGLGGLFVGALLVGAATSMPELFTNISAAASGAPDLAVADLFGAAMANMGTLAFIDLVHRGRVWASVRLGQALIGAVAIILTGIAVLGIVIEDRPVIGWIGIETLGILAAYILAMRWVQKASASLEADAHAPVEFMGPVLGTEAETPAGRRASLRRAGLLFALSAGFIIVAAPLLAFSAHGIAETAGIGQTIVGAALLAFATAAPEFVASITAVRIGAYDLAVGNLFGSNAFNMTVLVAADLAYLDGPILAAVDQSQVIAGVGAMLLMAIAIAALVPGERGRKRGIERDAMLLLGSYVVILGLVGMAST